MPLLSKSFYFVRLVFNFNRCKILLAPQAELLKTLSDILVHGGNSAVARRQAGLQLKNRLMSNDDAVRHAVQERWLQVRTREMSVFGPPNFLPDTMYQATRYLVQFVL